MQIQKNGITLRGSGAFPGGTVLEPPTSIPPTLCNKTYGPTGVCILAQKIDPKTGAVITPVHGDTVTVVTGFTGNGVFGYGTDEMNVTRVVAVNDGAYGIARFVSTESVFAHDVASGNHEAGFYVGDSPQADTIVQDNQAFGNQFGIFIRHARGVTVAGNLLGGNCQGIMVLDDGQPGGAGNTTIWHNSIVANNKFCPGSHDTPVNLQGGGILLLGATHNLVTGNSVAGNAGAQINSGGIVVARPRAVRGQQPRFQHDHRQHRPR